MPRGFIQAPPFFPPGGMRMPNAAPSMPPMPNMPPQMPNMPQQQGQGQQPQPSPMGQAPYQGGNPWFDAPPATPAYGGGAPGYGGAPNYAGAPGYGAAAPGYAGVPGYGAAAPGYGAAAPGYAGAQSFAAPGGQGFPAGQGAPTTAPGSAPLYVAPVPMPSTPQMSPNYPAPLGNGYGM